MIGNVLICQLTVSKFRYLYSLSLQSILSDVYSEVHYHILYCFKKNNKLSDAIMREKKRPMGMAVFFEDLVPDGDTEA